MHAKTSGNKPLIAISSCILGHPVRYDGEIKSFPGIYQNLETIFEFIPVCPEVEIGLTVPRPAVQLSDNIESPKMTGRDDLKIDITDRMMSFCKSKPKTLESICGYIFKSKSPSCGLHDIPIFKNGNIIHKNSRGLFAEAIINHFDHLPVAEETELQTEQQKNHFIQRVLNYSKNKIQESSS